MTLEQRSNISFK